LLVGAKVNNLYRQFGGIWNKGDCDDFKYGRLHYKNGAAT